MESAPFFSKLLKTIKKPRMKKFRSPIFLFFLLPFALSAQDEPREMSLDQAINYALENNLELKNAQINIADAKEQIVERRAIGIPQLSATVDYQYFIDIPTQILPDFISPAVYGVLFQEELLEPRNISTGEGGVPAQFGTKHNLTAGLNLNTMIFNANYFVGLKAARTYKQYVQQQLLATQADVRNQVVQAYMPPLIVGESIQTLENNIKNLEQTFFETQQLYKEGFVEMLDVDRLELSLANLRTERDNLVRQQEIAINALKFTIGFPMDQELTLSDGLEQIEADVQEEILYGPVNYFMRPEYAIAEMGIQLNELQVNLYRSAYLPSLNGFGAYQQSLFANKLSEGQWFPTTVVGLSLNVPIFDGLQKKAQVQRARLSLEIAQNQKKQLEQVISLEVENARTSYLSARERLASQKKNLDLAQRIYDTTQIKYREGVGSSLEITQSEQSLYSAQGNYNQALFDLVVAKANLDKAMGR
jgi:outer membrane protein